MRKEFQINLRGTERGFPKASWTVHNGRRKCGSKPGDADERWKELDEWRGVLGLARNHLLGACGTCFRGKVDATNKELASELSS